MNRNPPLAGEWKRRTQRVLLRIPIEVKGSGADGIAVAMEEHYSKAAMKKARMNLSYPDFQTAANKVRTAPLWGVRTHSRLMHDGASLTLTDAIQRHKGEAEKVVKKFRRLKPKQEEDLLTFLRSL